MKKRRVLFCLGFVVLAGLLVQPGEAAQQLRDCNAEGTAAQSAYISACSALPGADGSACWADSWHVYWSAYISCQSGGNT